VNEWKNKQWKEPFRMLFRGWGITIWKWYSISVPLINIHLGRSWRIAYDIFHNGSGFIIQFPPIIIINICIEGKIGWWYKKGLFRIRINKWQFEY